MAKVEFKDKFIAFIDVLGFKKLVEAAEAGTGMTLNKLLKVLENLGKPGKEERFRKLGPTVCPESAYLQRDLDFRLTQISDCAVVSSEVSPAGVINLVGHCWEAVVSLLQRGIMCRGYITRGPIFHTDAQMIGTGYQKAYENEGRVAAFKREADERGTPFVEVDPVVCDYVNSVKNPCVREMFSRFVRTDGEFVVLFPFQRLAHSFVIAGIGCRFDPDRERQSNQNVRLFIEGLKKRVMAFVDKSNPGAVRKAEHYIQALNAQLAVCDRTDEIIGLLSS